jgi:hypothetical protein
MICGTLGLELLDRDSVGGHSLERVEGVALEDIDQRFVVCNRGDPLEDFRRMQYADGRASLQVHRVSATSTRAWFISKIRIELLGGVVGRNLTHRKWQPTVIDDLDQKKSQRIAHFKAARSEHLTSLCFQKVVHTGSDYTAFHRYIVATL